MKKLVSIQSYRNLKIFRVIQRRLTTRKFVMSLSSQGNADKLY